MKNRLKYLSILYLGVLILVSSCTREPFEINDNNNPSGKVRLEMALNYVSDKQSVQTRGEVSPDQESEILADHVWVLIIDNNATEANKALKQAPVKAQVVENNKIYANLSPESSDSWVYVLANVTEAAGTYLHGLVKGTTLSEIIDNPAMKLTEATSSGLDNPFPMWGSTAEVVAQIKKGDVLSKTVNLTRAVARIDVVVDPAILPDDFQIRSVSVVNAAKSGWLFKKDIVSAQRLTEVIKYDPADVVSSVSTGTDNAIMNQVYCYENNGMIDATNKNVTRVIIEGSFDGKTSSSYYGVDIAYVPQAGGAVTKYDIERNKVYTITITKINKDGYASYDLAENSSSFNSGIDTEVKVTDPYSHNIVSNGKQYMGITNTHLLVYPKDNQEVKNVLAATLAYTTENGWPRGTMTASEGITFMSSDSDSEHLESRFGSTPVIRDVIIKLAPGFKKGTIEMRIGNLSQVLKITSHRITSPGGDIIEYFTKDIDGVGSASQTDFVVAEVIEPSADNDWLKVSDDVSALQSSSLFDKITSPSGELYVHIAGNIAYNATNATARKAQAFVTSKNDEQRYRVHVEQSYLDVYSDADPIEPYTYAGTFHRWNETAERIIRIEGNQTEYGESGAVHISGTWTASVVHGDFIMLSTEPSKESAIVSQDPYGELSQTSWNADALEAGGQFDVGEGRKVVTGSINTATTPNIYFKVGLTSRLSSFDAQPRYGLISLSYQSGVSAASSVQFIYVRQGEEEDYLMRPSDPVIYTSAYPSHLDNYRDPMATRPMARKISPFNLRTIADITEYRTDVPLDQHTFVDYPSKGGDYYFSIKGGVVPRMSGTFDRANVQVGDPLTELWNSQISETCPYGYRRISDNSNAGYIGINPWGSAMQTKGVLRLSETRQTFWLFPMNDRTLSNFSNQIKGYLADGFFDRRTIGPNEASPNIGAAIDKTYKHCIVKKDLKNRDVAFWGYLVFNPYNYASIFMPLAGNFLKKQSPFDTGIPYQDEGIFGGIQTTTGQTGNNQWIVNFGLMWGTNVFDNYQTSNHQNAYSVRCIRDEGEPVVGPPASGVTVTPFTDGAGEELYEVRITYNGTIGNSLRTQLEGAMGEKIKKMNSLRVVCNKVGDNLTADDYLYLNGLADLSQVLGTSTHSLHHLIIRGAGAATISAGAITSPYWRSVNIMEAKSIADGAFNLSEGSKLYNLSIGYFSSDISVNKEAFTGAFDYGNVNLKIRGYALTQVIDLTSWCNIKWKTITEYK